MTLRESLTLRLSDPDPEWRRLARWRLDMLDGASPAPAETETETGVADPPPPTPPRLFVRYAGPLPNCVHASAGLATACNPIRCHAYHGTTCGGSHATVEHCEACAWREPG